MQVEDLEAQVQGIQESYAKAADMQLLRETLDKKADLAAVDQLTGGSAQALQGVEGRLQAFEQALGASSEALKAVETTVATRASADEVAAVKSQAEVWRHLPAYTICRVLSDYGVAFPILVTRAGPSHQPS